MSFPAAGRTLFNRPVWQWQCGTDLEVVSDGCSVDEESVLGGRSQPKDRAAAHEQRSEVQGSLPLRRHPAPVGEDGLLDGVDELLHRRCRHAHALGAVLHPPRVLLRTEQRVPRPVRPPVRLHPLEQPLQEAGGTRWLQLQLQAGMRWNLLLLLKIFN